MPAPSIQELKKAVLNTGLEVYRTRGSELQLAERPRDNLIMDAGVALLTGETLRVRFVVRAQKADFQGEDDEALFARAASLGSGTLARGFAPVERRARALPDPGDPARTLDTWFEVVFERPVASLDEALTELPLLLRLDKAAVR